jgi:hypothetical protein
MKKDKSKEKVKKSESPEQVSPAEALKRMKSFARERKEKLVAAIRQSQD